MDGYYWLRPETEESGSKQDHAPLQQQQQQQPYDLQQDGRSEQSQQSRQRQEPCVYYKTTPSKPVDQRTSDKVGDEESKMQTTVYFLEREGEGLGSMHPAISRTPLFVNKETGRLTAGVPVEPDVMASGDDVPMPEMSPQTQYVTPNSGMRMSSTSSKRPRSSQRRPRRSSSDSDSAVSFSSLDEESMVATQATSLSRRRKRQVWGS